jgi:hypothetical protein
VHGRWTLFAVHRFLGRHKDRDRPLARDDEPYDPSMAIGRLASVSLLALAACGSPSPPPVPASPAPVPESPAPVSASPPAGARDVECVATEAHIKVAASRSSADVVAGSLGWPGLRDWATADPSSVGDPATGDYKVGAVVKAGSAVTVSIAAADGALNYGQSWGYSPAQSVTFHACADSDTAFIGGFHIAGRRCVPLAIAENGRPPTRVVVSFFAGRC